MSLPGDQPALLTMSHPLKGRREEGELILLSAGAPSQVSWAAGDTEADGVSGGAGTQVRGQGLPLAC